MENQKRPVAVVMWVAISIEAIIFLVVGLAPFGFDRRSSLGLDYDHLIIFRVLYVVALVVGVITSIIAGQRLALVLQIVFGGLFWMAIGYK